MAVQTGGNLTQDWGLISRICLSVSQRMCIVYWRLSLHSQYSLHSCYWFVIFWHLEKFQLGQRKSLFEMCIDFEALRVQLITGKKTPLMLWRQYWFLSGLGLCEICFQTIYFCFRYSKDGWTFPPYRVNTREEQAARENLRRWERKDLMGNVTKFWIVWLMW